MNGDDEVPTETGGKLTFRPQQRLRLHDWLKLPIAWVASNVDFRMRRSY